MTDVNSPANNSQAGSSPAEVKTDGAVQHQQTAQPSPATLNPTEPQPNQHVPYERFKEVNESAKQYKERLAAYEAKKQVYTVYEQLDEALKNDPALAEDVKKVLEKKFGRQEQAQQNSQAQQQPQVTDYQRVTYDRYVDDFNRIMDTEKIPDEYRQKIFSLLVQEAGQVNPTALNSYDRGLVTKAFDSIKPMFAGIKQQERETYVQQKKNDAVPASASGQGATQTQSFGDRNSRQSYIAQALKAGS